MLALENADEILQILDRFTKQKSKDIPPELEDYISYVAKTGDTVYRWPTVQYLFREKLRNVIKDFHDTTASIEDLPQCPNVDQFNYESMKTLLFERFDNFQAAPFTVQRLCELLTDPKKHYSRLDKFMRALEKNILVVSTVEPGRKPMENVDIDHLQPNGDISSDMIHDIETVKNANKLSTNGTSDKHKNCNANDDLVVKSEIPSSSGTSPVKTTEAEAKVAEIDIKMASVEDEKPAQSEISKSEAQPANEDQTMKTEPSVTETVEVVEPIVEAKPTVDDKPAEIDTTTAEKPEVKEEKEEIVKEEPQKIENQKTDSIQIEAEVKVEAEATDASATKPAAVEEKAIEAEKETIPMEEAVKNTPPTPKRAASASDEEDEKNPCAKKIRLDLNTVEDKTPEIEAAIPEVDLQKEADVLDSISTEIDAQKKDDLLEQVDAALSVDKDPINIDVQPIIESVAIDAEAIIKSVADAPPVDLLQTADDAIPSDLDFTPDEALNDLVSSDILAAIPEQPAKEVNDEPPVNNVTEPEPAESVAAPVPAKIDDETVAAAVATATETVAAAVADEMNVETVVESVANENAENAMESAPIKADEEQMDVDESNSVDAMDL